MAKYKRILLKLSGESLMGEKQYGIDEKRLAEYAEQIKEIHQQGVQIGIVIGGGNIFRGLSGANKGFDRNDADDKRHDISNDHDRKSFGCQQVAHFEKLIA